MGEVRDTARVTVSETGVRSVSPAEIFRSRKGQEQIRKTTRVVKVEPPKSKRKA